MKKIDGGVTAPKGFSAMGVHAGIKKDKKDMAMIYSSVPCIAAGTFTTNQVKAAPVKWDRKMIFENEFSNAAHGPKIKSRSSLTVSVNDILMSQRACLKLIVKRTVE